MWADGLGLRGLVPTPIPNPEDHDIELFPVNPREAVNVPQVLVDDPEYLYCGIPKQDFNSIASNLLCFYYLAQPQPYVYMFIYGSFLYCISPLLLSTCACLSLLSDRRQYYVPNECINK